MADDVPLPDHISRRGGVLQYVRRVPEDLRVAFPFARVQRSLRTADPRQARAAALDLDRHWDERFAEARRARGLDADANGPAALATEGWAWADWEALARWFGSSLAEEDWRARLGALSGGALGPEPDPARLPWREPSVTREHIARGRRLTEITVAEYATERLAFVQGHVRRLGIGLSRTDPSFERFMAACLAAELAFLHLAHSRESRRGGIGNEHPDAVEGPWRRRPAPAAARPPEVGPPAGAGGAVGKRFRDCRAKWVENRERVRKDVRPEYLREMDHTVALFEQHAGVTDIGLVRRRHVVAFRDHLASGDTYKTATVNKKIGFVSSLLSTALNAGWIDAGLGSDLFLEVPQDEGGREPYAEAQLATLFSHPVFTAGERLTRAKAGGELQFWLPLIASTHGMISSEILRMGPDTVGPHPDHPGITCFTVTNAGDRRVKTLARRRWIPVRRELLALGLGRVVDEARRDGRRWLWRAMDAGGGNVTRVSGHFSSHWAQFAASVPGCEGFTLYGLRHGFQDRLAQAGHDESMKKALMGHAESGMTKVYGAKRQPRVVNLPELDRAIQGLPWPFLKGVRAQAEA